MYFWWNLYKINILYYIVVHFVNIIIEDNVFLSVFPKIPVTITKEWQEAEVISMITQRAGAIEGISSHYDYENQKWK